MAKLTGNWRLVPIKRAFRKTEMVLEVEFAYDTYHWDGWEEYTRHNIKWRRAKYNDALELGVLKNG